MLTGSKYWLWLTGQVGPEAAWAVYSHFGSPEKAWFADEAEYDQIQELSPEAKGKLRLRDLTAAQAIQERCARKGIRILTFQDADYPERLRSLPAPPLVLYLRGTLFPFDDRAVIALAGTRRATPYGRKAAYQFGRSLAQAGALVATGLAAGCDEQAARGALSGGGNLVCVLAGGVDLPYSDTEEGRALLEEIAGRGALLSEAPPGTRHLGALFRRRNLILSGLSVGLLCIEAGSRSGVLSVAARAGELGKDVFALPANLGAKSSQGTNDLLRQGLAQAVLCPEDILSRYPFLLPRSQGQPGKITVFHLAPDGRVTREERDDLPRKEPPPPAQTSQKKDLEQNSPPKKVDTGKNSGYIEILDASGRWSAEERTLLKALVPGPATAEALTAQCGLPSGVVMATLTLLAVSGAVEELPGGRFQLVPSGLS